ncbi:hypothetical protein BDV18DRAFT_158287 [Aspergillus unguis]
MKLSNILITTLASLVASSPARETRLSHPIGGTGPYPATWTTIPSLQNHTVYLPVSPLNEPLPLLVWGNGACSSNGTKFANFLIEIASHGFIAIASGTPNSNGSTTSQLMRDAITWAFEQTDSTPTSNVLAVPSINTASIAVAGQSCGGLEAYQLRDDERVRFLGIFNSGFISPDTQDVPTDGTMPLEDPDSITEVHKPVFYFLGGPTDIAFENGNRDYEALSGVPKWIGNYPVGHTGTYQEENGGAFGVAAVKWLQYVLRGDEEAGLFFTGGGAEAVGWNGTDSEGLDRIGEY